MLQRGTLNGTTPSAEALAAAESETRRRVARCARRAEELLAAEAHYSGERVLRRLVWVGEPLDEVRVASMLKVGRCSRELSLVVQRVVVLLSCLFHATFVGPSEKMWGRCIAFGAIF